MEMATMSCERPTKEEIRVVVEYPDQNGLACLKCLCTALVVLTALAIGSCFFWIVPLMHHCRKLPGLDLKDVDVHAMNMYQNNTLPGSPYQANSDISVQLKAFNPNTVAGCFTTFRRVAVSVDFKGQQILHQLVPLEAFGLKPRESRTMTLESKGESASLTNEVGSLLALKVQNASALELRFWLAARFMRNDRKAAWMYMYCDTITNAPPTSSNGLVYRLCTYYD